MQDDNALLDEIVVVGYGQQKKVNLTGAVSTVDVDQSLQSRPVQDIDKALQGAVQITVWLLFHLTVCIRS